MLNLILYTWVVFFCSHYNSVMDLGHSVDLRHSVMDLRHSVIDLRHSVDLGHPVMDLRHSVMHVRHSVIELGYDQVAHDRNFKISTSVT